ncbi:phosphopantetheine-binding protein [Cellulosilyticum ruminicola]|uniref:phosphopantetheine-binding protein n=1 Tax=Cellulosilyticum ruminicola TaxID=425254 RepID=UPI0006D0A2DA|nr:phosphopantetheine-binding protein [Cellulosilyticum ruminicola]
MREIEKRTAEIILKHINNNGLTPEQLLISDLRTLNINSLNFIKIIVDIEEEFDVEFEDDKINYEMFGNITDLIGMIEELQNN